MRVQYRSILKEIDVKLDQARRADRTIETIFLTPPEWIDFRHETFHLYHYWSEPAAYNKVIRYDGVEIMQESV